VASLRLCRRSLAASPQVACSPVVRRWSELGDLVGFLGEEPEDRIAFLCHALLLDLFVISYFLRILFVIVHRQSLFGVFLDPVHVKKTKFD
jgi:hypothetical protein